MFKRLSIHIALVFLFVFAQIGAVTHEISHVEDLVKHSQQGQSKQDNNAHNEKCGQCLSFAKVGTGLATQSFALLVLSFGFIGSAQLSTQATSQTHTAYAARAPPYLS